ncbi:hypothetical protein PVAND_001687 [Polypedilum vanderplanki]|uniref:Uncharacterized protein n=1 Tax=Polypedilum vanderplanki TaxID=319348 RepID=A0A9J6BP57_POLVA|nr:hypothetical protein PVAND_001687 [Polypedilum vanderplanki]
MSLKWKRGDVSSRLPRKAHRGGTDVCGAEIYVGRALHNGWMLPAKIIPSKRSAYVSYNGAEIPVQNFEVLVGKEKYFSWRPAADGNTTEGAISTGPYGSGCEELFIGRVAHQGSMTVGKIHPSHRCLYIGFNGLEIAYSCYEVLVWTGKRKDQKKKKKKRSSSSSSSGSSSSD